MKRLAAIAATLLACQSAFALVAENFGHQASAAVGTTAVIASHVRVTDDLGAPVAGVPYVFEIDAACAAFPGGATTSSGITDESGLARSELWTTTALAPACDLQFEAQGVEGGLALPIFVFSPADVVLSANTEGFDTTFCRTHKFFVFATVGGTPVYAFPTVVATSSPNGATATIGFVNGPVDGGTFSVEFTTNQVQGRYEIRASYGNSFVSVPVDQKKFKGVICS